MMDLVTCEAPLNNSFQKDRLELVNKGSLGRRRKPSRSNLKLLLSPSNNSLPSTPSTPALRTKELVINGGVRKESCSHRNYKSKHQLESSLPRTTPESQYVLEAKQFSVEAKIKRKKSDLGKSAVLIQTWERRTQWDNFTKQQQASKNRFQNKENLPIFEHASAMPDSYICPKYKGSLQNGESLKKGEWVPAVRDSNCSEAMVHRIPENGPRNIKQSNVNGEIKAPNLEPEWISLSRKLCAKFVEGHIEHHSTDSYRHEEPEGVRPEKKSSPPVERKRTSEPPPKEEQKKKKVLDSPVPENQTAEPPWIHLSRKLCTKFIEEHIEHPVILSDQFVPKPELIEPNGDVRIIEKIGKPKSRKSKHKKESEPEWVSLSRKLRAKFIESHIDDPDTISLDNQLNASDPEETSSESLSDTSQEIVVEKKTCNAPKYLERKGKNLDHNIEQKSDPSPHENDFLHRNGNSLLFPEKECCWEYQEMEFDQESNSGTFQEPEFCDGTLNEDVPLQEARIRRGSIPQDHSDSLELSPDCRPGNITFADLENSRSLPTAECYNNDVNFGSSFAPKSSTPISGSGEKKDKLFTIQFIARPENSLKNNQKAGCSPVSASPPKNIQGSFFNLSTWEEAHCKSEDEGIEEGNENSCLDSNLKKDFRSKSLDDICDSKQEIYQPKQSTPLQKERKHPECFNNVLISKENLLCKSEEVLHQPERSGSFQNQLNDFKIEKNEETFREVKNTDGIYGDVMKSNFSSEDEQRNCEKVSLNCPTSNIVNNIENSHSKSAKSNDHKASKKDCSFKCNGVIPNSRVNDLKGTSVHPIPANQKQISNGTKPQTSKLGMSKWINISKSEQTLSKNEYANIRPQQEEKVAQMKESNSLNRYSNGYGLHNSSLQGASPTSLDDCKQSNSKQKLPPKNAGNYNDCTTSSSSSKDSYASRNQVACDKDRMIKSKSLCDVSCSKSFPSENKLSSKNLERLNGSFADAPSCARAPSLPRIEFQDFDLGAEIPLCAKLVSNQNKKHSKRNSSISSSSNRNESPCSESSHVYEDMFKETTSCPSDSEASSWTVMKNNSYYINGRSSSMNDLDFSDSCSLSVKCDYASSCSGQSTLQSRQSSCASSSFYVNLRDYDSHMLEPSLNKKKKDNRKCASNGNVSKISKSNPPTPESLRHLFTSPLSSIHTPPIRNSRIVNRIQPDPHQSHYYSTAAATSSAFKLGFDPPPQKPKKTERSSSIKIKDIAHGIILTFKRFQNHSKNSHVSPTHYVDVSHLAEYGSKTSNGSESGKPRTKKGQEKHHFGQNGKTDSDSGCHLAPPDKQRAKARRSSSDLTGMRSGLDILNQDKKKSKNSKKNNRDKKKNRSKTTEARTVPTVSRKVQQMADGTFYLVTTVSGDTALPGVYSDSPDTSSELSCHRPVKVSGESNC